MQTLYLIRHTTPNITPGICYGQFDTDVADSFASEAANALNWLPPVELVIASPLLRAQRLAEYLAQQQRCPSLSDARLMELHFGDWEGRAWNDIARGEIDAWAADTLNYASPNGESAQQMMRRVQDALLDVTRLPQRHIALVAHSGSIRALLAQLSAIPLAHTLNWQIDFGAVIGVKLNNSRT
ncbi:MAG: alpha-ribazole phosphatase [Gallionellaceae bacterium]|nr:alpha-ribazole phosphatase [Gallionellaceae bacterium]